MRLASRCHGGLGNGCADHGGGRGIDTTRRTVWACVDACSRRPRLSGAVGRTKPQGTADLFFVAGDSTTPSPRPLGARRNAILGSAGVLVFTVCPRAGVFFGATVPGFAEVGQCSRRHSPKPLCGAEIL